MLLKIYPDNPNPKEIDRVANTLRDGGLVIYPTDTLYAIGCDALNIRAVERICRIKGIDPQKSKLSIVCHDLSEAGAYTRIDNDAFKLMKRHLPGAFTFILPAGPDLPRIYKNRREVGLRIPDNVIACELVRALGNPMLTMSVRDPASESEDPEYLTDPELIHEKFDGRVDIVIDGGIGEAVGSTVVDCTTQPFAILRQGKGVMDGV
ncbi:threonylcarbamoyl-AMP synthase [Tannerella sp. oral taxon 808]|nr:threonylcarbamoyl-AMP synthase [Tannerella sp. oral taxon 808]